MISTYMIIMIHSLYKFDPTVDSETKSLSKHAKVVVIL